MYSNQYPRDFSSARQWLMLKVWSKELEGCCAERWDPESSAIVSVPSGMRWTASLEPHFEQ